MSKKMPKFKKAGLIFFIPILCAAFLSAQSLVEVAQKEKERREKLKGKNAKVVTNVDLKAMNKAYGIVSVPTQIQASANRQSRLAEETASRQASKSPELTPPKFATEVLPDTNRVTNPQAALGSPNGNFAEISIFGFLDLEFSAKNGPGDDIAIYARRSGKEEGIWPDTLTCGVLALGDRGDWEALGRVAGISSPEKFDLGRISSTTKIRIVFKYYDNADLGAKFYRLHPGEYTVGIDAVEALH